MPHRRDNGSEGRETYDAVVIGAGVVGLACAWRAASRGLRVCVLERDRPGAGASGVAAGMLAPVGEVSWGEERLLRANLASAAAWPAFAGELGEASGREVGYRARGALHVALDRDEAEELRRRHELQVSLGLEAEWLRPTACRRLEPGLATSIAGGIHAPDEAEADPRVVVAALSEAFARAGGMLIAGDEPVEALLAGGRIAGVRTRGGRAMRAEQVVLATGAWAGETGWLPVEARPPVRPVKGQILVLRGEQPACERIVASRRVYLVPRADGRLVVGATVEERGFETAVTAGGVHELLREAYRLLPEVAELEIAEMTAGLRPGSPDNAPLVGAGRLEGLLLATGHYRNGVLLAPLTADAVAALLTGDDAPEAAAGLAPARFRHEGVPA
ncbi:MAG TPA: glycine oxidase ThiO [Solirubrobacterales bacterium]